MRSKAIIFYFLLLTPLLLYSEVQTSIDLRQMLILSRTDSNTPGFSGAGEAGIFFRSVDNQDVRAELALKAQFSDKAWLDIDRAFIRARFPRFRTTIGKARLSWGDGFFFNAGDVLFGSENPVADLSRDEIRTEAAWLTAAYLPLGRFSFLELVLLPPQPDLSGLLGQSLDDSPNGEPPDPGPGLPTADKLSTGARIQGKLLDIKTEAGYLYRGVGNTHHPYISLQGNLYLDWYAAATLSLEEELQNTLGDQLTLSFGFFHIIRITRDSSLNLRLEGLISPGAAWQADDSPADAAGAEILYGLYLYPELIASFPGNRNLFLRGVYSPLDSSALITLGGSWNIYQGFTLLAHASCQIGSENDQFGYKRPGGYALAAGVRFVF